MGEAQQLAAAVLLSGAPAPLDTRRRTIARQEAHLRTRLAEALPDWKTHRPEGGLSLWVELPRADSTRLALAAPDHGVRIAPGVRFGINGAYERFLRLPFSRHEADLDRAIDALLRHASDHAATPILARTLMQPASVTSFGLKCAGWAAPLVRSRVRMRTTKARALCVQLGGAVGTLAQMKGMGPAVMQRMADDLGLANAGATWHTQRDEWIALGCELGLLTGSLGKIATDIALMGQYEVGEVTEPSEPGRGGSSAMPHKRNPVASMVSLAAAHRAPQRVAALLAAMPQEHERALGAWQAELAEWPLLLLSAHGSARAMAGALPGLTINVARMRANIDTLRGELPKAAADEWFSPALAQHAAGLATTQVDALRAQLKGIS